MEAGTLILGMIIGVGMTIGIAYLVIRLIQEKLKKKE